MSRINKVQKELIDAVIEQEVKRYCAKDKHRNIKKHEEPKTNLQWDTQLSTSSISFMMICETLYTVPVLVFWFSSF